MIYYASKRSFCLFVCEAARERGLNLRMGPRGFFNWSNGVAGGLINDPQEALFSACRRLADELSLGIGFDDTMGPASPDFSYPHIYAENMWEKFIWPR